MFDSLGFEEILFIVVIALVVVGPRDLVRVSGKLGRMLGELKRQLQTAQTAVQKEVDQAMEAEALQRIEAENRRIMIETGVLDAQGRPVTIAAPDGATPAAAEAAAGEMKAGEKPH